MIDDLFNWPEGKPGAGTESSLRVGIDAHHPVFKGHFPDRPILPGVCMVHLATMIASSMHGSTLNMVRARSIKFLAPVDPTATPELLIRSVLTPTEEGIRLESVAHAGDTIVMKINAILVPDQQ